MRPIFVKCLSRGLLLQHSLFAWVARTFAATQSICRSCEDFCCNTVYLQESRGLLLQRSLFAGVAEIQAGIGIKITNVESSDNYIQFASNIQFGKRHTFNRAWHIHHSRENFHSDDNFLSQASSQDWVVTIHDIINPKLHVALLIIKFLQYIAAAIPAQLAFLYLLSCVTLNHNQFVGPAHDGFLWTCCLPFPNHDFGQWQLPVIVMICARLTRLSPIGWLLLRSQMELVLHCNFLK